MLTSKLLFFLLLQKSKLRLILTKKKCFVLFNCSSNLPYCEKVLDGPFDGVFSLLTSLDVCESDNILKALVYAFCRRARGLTFTFTWFISLGLEFVLYLISKETHLCTDSAVLFRADSFATKVNNILNYSLSFRRLSSILSLLVCHFYL